MYFIKDLHEVVLSQITSTLKHGASLYVAVRSERDWVAADLEDKGFYRPGETNECYPAMAKALEPQGITNWPLYFFRGGLQSFLELVLDKLSRKCGIIYLL